MLAESDALKALADRGVNLPEELLHYGTPDQIVATCMRWDTQVGVSPGLLVKWVRDGNFPPPDPPSTAERLQAQYDAHHQRLPAGTPIERHASLERRVWHRDENCGGTMRVDRSSFYPLLLLVCDHCGFEHGVPVRDLHRLKPAEEPDIAF